MNNNNHSIDVAYDMRRQAREQAENEQKQREAQKKQGEYYRTKTEYEQLMTVGLPEAEQEQERINQELHEPPPIPQEGRLKMNLIKALVYGGISVFMIIAGAVLAFSVLDIVLYLFPVIVRWIMAIAIIGGSIAIFHWAVQQMNPRMRNILIFSLLFVALINIGALAWIRAEYSSVKTQQESGEMTAEQAQEKASKLEWMLVFVHAILAIALETLGALTASRAAVLFDQNWPELSKCSIS